MRGRMGEPGLEMEGLPFIGHTVKSEDAMLTQTLFPDPGKGKKWGEALDGWKKGKNVRKMRKRDIEGYWRREKDHRRRRKGYIRIIYRVIQQRRPPYRDHVLSTSAYISSQQVGKISPNALLVKEMN